MAESATEICNLALTHLGSTVEIEDLDDEGSDEAIICRRVFANTRDAVLRDFHWPFATKIQALGLVEEDPNSEWAYSYRTPSDCLNVRRILSGIRNDSRQSRVPYRIGQDVQGELIFTDKEDAELEYTTRITDVVRFPADFVNALALRVAAYIAPKLTAGDPFKLGERALQLYLREISNAQANAANEEQAEEPVESEFIRGRE